MTVLDMVYDPSPIPHDQPGILANATTTTDTIPAERTLGMEDVMTESKRESPQLLGALLRLQLQSSPSSVALHTSLEEATACGTVPPERAEPLLIAFGPTIQEQRTQSSETSFMSPAWMHAFLRTAPQSCFFQDLLRAVCHYCDLFPRKKLSDVDAIFTFNAGGYRSDPTTRSPRSGWIGG